MIATLKDTAQNLRADKAFGQNFLLDQGLCDDIASALQTSSNVLEIGPGPGGLTRAMLAQGKNVCALDIDPRMIAALHPLQATYPEHLTLLEANALKLDLNDYSEPMILAGNLPFNIATKLLLRWLPQGQKIAEMLLMFQAEVAERILAQPNTKPYGRLSVLAQYLMKIHLHREIPASAFTPAPKVDAMVLHFMPHEDYAKRITLYPILDSVLKLAFAARRKTLGRGLKGRIDGHLEILEQASLDPRLRAEDLHVDDFVRLATIINNESSSPDTGC